jgi:Rrf2 family transcriptional regulator, cysteine metabolism repressor
MVTIRSQLAMSTLLSKKTDYALLILAHLHQNPGGVSAREISDRYSLSKAFLANISKESCQKGYLVSHRGVKGGYQLRRSASEMNLAEIFEALEDGLALTACNNHPGHQHEGECSVINMCPIRGPINELYRRVSDMLREVRLSDLFTPTHTTHGHTFQNVLPVLNIHMPRNNHEEVPA